MTQTIHNTTYLPPLKNVVSTYPAPWYVKIATKIKEIIKKIFSPFFFWRKDKGEWIKKKIEVLDQIKNREFLQRQNDPINNKIEEIERSPRLPSKSMYSTTNFALPIETMHKSLTQVLEKSINEICEKKPHDLSSTNKNLEDIYTLISPLIQNNSSLIATEISGRIAEISEKIDFKSIIDQFIALLVSQVKNYLRAENRVKKGMHSEGIHSFASEVARNYIYQELPKAYLSLNETDSKTKSTFEVEKDIDKKIKVYLKSFIDTAFDRIFSAVETEKNKKLYTTDRLTHIWDQLNIPEFLSNVFKEMGIENEIRDTISKLGPPIIKKILLEYSFVLYKKYFSKEMIFKVFAEIIFPTLTEKSLVRHVQNIILHNQQILKPILLNLRTSNNIESVKTELKEKIFALTQKNCSFLDFKENNITQDYLNKKILNSKVDALKEALTHPSLREESIETILDKLYMTDHSETDDRLSELFFDTFLKVGEFEGGLKNISYLVRQPVNMLLGNMIYPLIKEKYRPIEILTTLLVQERSEMTMSTSASSQNKIYNEIQKLSHIIYDIGVENIKSSSNALTRPLKLIALKKTLGEDPSKIQNATINIFNKLFTHHVLNTDLFYKTQNIILGCLQVAN